MQTLDSQLNVRVEEWLYNAVEQAAKERREKGERVRPADIVRETLWQRFQQARPKEATP